MKRKEGLAFHCHHDVLVEYVYDYDDRVKYIKQNKPKAERELRLKLFKLIPEDKLPGAGSGARDAFVKERVAFVKAGDAFVKAWVAYNKAWVAYNKAGDAYNKARDAYNKAWVAYCKEYKEELEQLHTELCPDCTWDGKTIFTGEKKDLP